MSTFKQERQGMKQERVNDVFAVPPAVKDDGLLTWAAMLMDHFVGLKRKRSNFGRAIFFSQKAKSKLFCLSNALIVVIIMAGGDSAEGGFLAGYTHSSFL